VFQGLLILLQIFLVDMEIALLHRFTFNASLQHQDTASKNKSLLSLENKESLIVTQTQIWETVGKDYDV